MPIYHAPVVGQWYRHTDKGYQFQVTAVDEDDRTAELQHFDGDVAEIDLADWYTLGIEPIETPEDWTGPMDSVKRDELGYTETDMSQEDWEAPLQEHIQIAQAPDQEPENEIEEDEKEKSV